ncbi:hypothetical protein [Pontibacter vulgaris]|uniref:hypothetical protein n=1 Tax=Pontibacter vulgaris TaxID=2905679 RepID=UPI001FA6DA6C|nr:hypothetical protein [Pontibacter vulgaris]
MKKVMVLICLSLGIGFSASATSGNTTTSGDKAVDKKATMVIEKRATNLSDQMIRELRLNNYQSAKIRAINLDKVNKMQAVETAYAGNQQLIDEKCKAICSERDRELENVLSTIQYNKYFGARKAFTKQDREFVASLNNQNSNGGSSEIATADNATQANNTATPAVN